MIEQSIRHYYQAIFVDPAAVWISRWISPNGITYLSGTLGILVLPALWFDFVGLAVVLLILSGYCDTLDGSIARALNQVSDWGSALDIVMDRLVEIVVVFALYSVDPGARGVWCLLMLSSMLLCITSFLVVGIFSENHSHKSFHYSAGFMERAEAFVFFVVMMIWPSFFGLLALLFSVLVFVTAFIRLKQFRFQS